jgi:hypothetical protein
MNRAECCSISRKPASQPGLVGKTRDRVRKSRLMALRSKPSGLKSAAEQGEHALWVGFVELNELSQSQLLTFAVI